MYNQQYQYLYDPSLNKLTEYSVTTPYWQQRGKILKNEYFQELRRYNSNATKNIPYSPDALLSLDMALENFTDARITAQSKLIREINGCVTPLLEMHNAIELDLQCGKIKREDYVLILESYKKLIDLGPDLLVFKSNIGEAIKRNIIKMLPLPKHCNI